MVVNTPIQRPDLAIYSQAEQILLGQPPTWDSPDIVASYLPNNQLIPEILVTIRNVSPNCSAVNAVVSLLLAPFGIGMARTLQGQTTISLNALAETTIPFPLSQTILKQVPQEVSVYVKITHPQDVNLINNNGAQILMGLSTTASGRNIAISIPVQNPLGSAQTITLNLAPNLLAAVIPPTVAIAGSSQVMVPLTVQVPAAAHGTPEHPLRFDATVVAIGEDGSMIDGLTYAIFVDN